MNSSSVVATASSVARRLRSLSSSATMRSPSLIAGGSSISEAGSKTTPITNTATTTPHTVYTAAAAAVSPSAIARRSFGSGGGTRGARGHGWWVNYRAGKGGRHLQGTYSHLDVDAMNEWNDAVFELGSKLAYLDVVVEALAGGDEEEETTNHDGTEQKQLHQKTIHRLTLELATEAMPLATENVLKLLQEGASGNDNDNDTVPGYHATTLHRIEKGVGILGGLVSDNPNHQKLNPNAPLTKRKKGMCHPSLRMATSPTSMDVSSEKLVLNHLEGVLTMLQPRIGEIDSRFLVLTHDAPHMDGVSVAIGRLKTAESLEAVQTWESSLITSYGVPTNVALKIVGCGLLEEENKTQHTEEGSQSQ